MKNILGTSIDKAEEAYTDISKTLFWSGYRIWKKRKLLNGIFWKRIAPEEWKKKGKIRIQREKKENVTEVIKLGKLSKPSALLSKKL